jgi:hypothetical protein
MLLSFINGRKDNKTRSLRAHINKSLFDPAWKTVVESKIQEPHLLQCSEELQVNKKILAEEIHMYVNFFCRNFIYTVESR